MKLTDIENPLVIDSQNPVYIKTPLGRAKVVGYTPTIPITTEKWGYPYWHVLIEGDKPGNEKCVFDGEII
jgi:hypothetical protein